MLKNPYEQEQATAYEVTMSDRIWQLIRFAVVTGMIFGISFFAINFQAYSSILAAIIRPEMQQEIQKVLSEASNSGKGSAISSTTLLPLLNEVKETRKAFPWLDFPIVPTDNRLVIPKLGKSVPIVEMGTENIEGQNWSELEKQIQEGLRGGVVHYPGTAKPGQIGNVFLTGHSSYYPWDSGLFKDVFAVLNNLEVNDEYFIYYDQKKYTYKVREKLEVQPDNVQVLQQPHDKKMSTLMTCTPVGTALRRLIIKAEDIS